MSLLKKNLHLMWRAGFGPAAAQLEQLSKISPHQLYNALQKASSKGPEFIDVADSHLKGLMMGIDNEVKLSKTKLEPTERKVIQQKQRDGLKSLNLFWLDEMVNSKAQLREKMSLFWHGHFASRNINVFYQQDLLHIIRENALGSFRTLLHDVSKSAAMLNFLNAAQNRKGHPNENFAREVMELFTLGRGNYSENDVKEAARAFTGWSVNLKGEFIFRKFQHDAGVKTIFGKSGNFSGEDVLDMLLDQKETATYITKKIYKYFVNEKPDEGHIAWLSKRFYDSDYSIGGLMDDIVTSDWFYDEKNIGTKIKSPIELIAGIRRMLPMEIETKDSLLLLQRLLGQMLFYPPNVAGWPGGKAWIDSSTLMLRLRLPQLIANEDEWNVRPKLDDDQMMGQSDHKTKNGESKSSKGFSKLAKPVIADIDWKAYVKNFDKLPKDVLIDVITQTLMPGKCDINSGVLKNFADYSTKENFIKTATIQLMSTPNYQLC